MAIPKRLAPDIVDGVEVPRPLRICSVCGVVDDHPKHVVGFDPDTIPVNKDQIKYVIGEEDLTDDEKASIIADIMDTSTDWRHFDCCTNAGCPEKDPEKSCDRFSNDLKGAELLSAITGQPVEDLVSKEA
jgi:hypothetical protein